jgi:hypothetical protein
MPPSPIPPPTSPAIALPSAADVRAARRADVVEVLADGIFELLVQSDGRVENADVPAGLSAPPREVAPQNEPTSTHVALLVRRRRHA